MRALPRTSLNYDQFYTLRRATALATLFALPYNLAGTPPIPVDLGLSINTAAGQPCATPILGTGFANPACNGVFQLQPLRAQSRAISSGADQLSEQLFSLDGFGGEVQLLQIGQ